MVDVMLPNLKASISSVTCPAVVGRKKTPWKSKVSGWLYRCSVVLKCCCTAARMVDTRTPPCAAASLPQPARMHKAVGS